MTKLLRSKAALTALGQRVREIRTAKGMTHNELAEGIVTSAMIALIEKGQVIPSSMLLEDLAKRLGTTTDDFFRGIVFHQLHMSAYKVALSQMEVNMHASALLILEDLVSEKILDQDIPAGELMLHLAVCYRETERYQEAVDVLEALLTSWEQELESQRNFHVCMQALLQMSETYLRMNRYFDALYHATRARDEYLKKGSPDPMLFGKILVHLANLYEQVHQFNEASNCYKQALDVYGQLGGQISDVGMIYQRLAEVYYHQNNSAMTIEFANKAILSLQASRMVSEYRDAKRLMIVHQVNQDNWEDSVATLLELVKFYVTHDVVKEAGLYLDVAEICLKHAPDVAGGLRYAMRGLSKLTDQAVERELLGRAYLLLGRMYQQLNDLEQAERMLVQAMDVYKRLKCLGELEKAARQLGALLVQKNDHKQALAVHETTHDFIVEQLRTRGVTL